VGNDAATVRIDHLFDFGYFRQERFETATVAGTVSFDESPLWDDQLTFTGDDAGIATIGTANSVSLP